MGREGLAYKRAGRTKRRRRRVESDREWGRGGGKRICGRSEVWL